MKKITAIFLVLALMAALAACAGAPASGQTAAPTPDASTDPAPVSEAPGAEAPEAVNARTCASLMDYLGLDFSGGSVRIPNTTCVAVLRGSWYDMGTQYADQASEAIRYYIGSQLNNAIAAWGSLETVYAALPEYETMLEEVFPTYLDFVRGITDGLTAQGWDIDYQDVLIGYISLGPADFACMAASAWGEATADGKTYAAIHSDSSHQAVYTQPTILAYPEDGNAFISVVGFTNAYINDKGLVCMGTMGYGFAEDDTAAGIPIGSNLLYNAVYASSTEQALENHIEKLRVGSGEIIHYVDASGDAAILETTAAHYAVRRSGEFGETDYLLQSNGWLTGEMQSSSPELPDNTFRYQTAKQYIDAHCGSISMDTLREALSQTSYYDAETGKTVYNWTLDPDEACFSPENKDITYGCAMRRVMDLENRDIYILMGSEYDLISKVPESLGTYCRLHLEEDPAAVARTALTEARTQVWYAARDLEAAREGGEDLAGRMECFDTAREAVFQALNCLTLAGAAPGEGEQLQLLGQSLSAAAMAQCYAKAAQGGDPAELADR